MAQTPDAVDNIKDTMPIRENHKAAKGAAASDHRENI